MLPFVSAALYLFLCASPSEAYIPKVVYVTMSRSVTTSTIANSTVGTKLDIVSQTDDSPFQKIDLPFRFPFFGEDIVRLHASPNGGLFLNNEPACGDSYASQNCNANNYTGAIGILIHDFDLGATNTSDVTFFSTADEVHVSYTGVTEWNIDPETTDRIFAFSSSLYPDGSLTFRYSNVPAMDAVDHTWWAGIRPETPYEDKFVITPEQASVGSQQWLTLTKGVYAHKDDVATGKQVQFCPVSTTWCLTPSVIDALSFPNTFQFTPLSMSCASDVEIGYYVGNTDPSNATPCILNTSSAYTTYVCSNQSLPRPIVQATTLDLKLAWRSASNVQFQALAVSSFHLHVTTGSINNDKSAYDNCTSNTAACGGFDCGLCVNDLQCLDLPCEDKVNDVPDLYGNFSCDGTCAITSAEDWSGVCCNNNFIDCAGVCNGTAISALKNDGTDRYECCKSGIVDCFNRCEGEGVFDTCGVCRLPEDQSGEVCETWFNVDTGFNNNTMFVHYSSEYNSSSDLKDLNYYNVSFENFNSTDVVFSISLHNANTEKGPVVFLPDRDFVVPAFETIYLSIPSSITDILSGNQSAWEAKTIRVLFGRPEVFSYRIALDLKLYPDTMNCSSITSRSTCINLPGCMHCYSNPGYRVLYISDDESCPSNSSGVNDSSKCGRRDLFSNVIPSSADANIGDPSKRGVCQNAWRTTDCVNNDNIHRAVQYEQSSVVHISVGACIFFAFYTAAFYFFSY